MSKHADTGSNERQTAATTTNKTSSTTTCDECGAYVTRDYHRVFSDRDGSLNGCIECVGQGTDRGGNR